MKENSVYNCPECGTWHNAVLQEPSLLACKNCGAIIFEKIVRGLKPEASKIPEDWSFIQLGTTGQYQEHSFTVVGRIRVQLRNDYKNFWCAEYDQGKCLLIMESFASCAVFASPWHAYRKEPSKLRAGATIPLDAPLQPKGEYVEKCEDIGYQGEVGNWKFFYKGFFLVQASQPDGQTVVFALEPRKDVIYITGEKIVMEKLNLKNIVVWNEWK